MGFMHARATHLPEVYYGPHAAGASAGDPTAMDLEIHHENNNDRKIMTRSLMLTRASPDTSHGIVIAKRWVRILPSHRAPSTTREPWNTARSRLV